MTITMNVKDGEIYDSFIRDSEIKRNIFNRIIMINGVNSIFLGFFQRK